MTEEPQSIFDKYSDKFLELASDYNHAGIPDRYDASGGQTGQCGDTVHFFLSVMHKRIVEVRFALEGCMHTLACANAIVEMIAEKPVEEAWDVTDDAVAEYLGGLPEDHYHCAELAVGALYKTLADLKTKIGVG